MTTYKPSPIDTSKVDLGADLNELIERLAGNNHDHWARKRIEEGWQHGPVRDDRTKQHPDLVPYNQLTESEKDYDRTSVVETLKAISALGYVIRQT